MTSHLSIPPSMERRMTVILFVLLALNAVVQVVLRVCISDSLDLDEAEQVLFAQWRVLGYGSQPPLYNWIQQGFFAVIPHQVLALSMFKHLLFLSMFVLMYRSARLLFRSVPISVLAVAMLFLVPEIIFEGQRDLTHSVIASVCSLWFFYALIIVLVKSNRGIDFVRFGLALGCCLLSKYNTLLMIVPLLAVLAGIGVLRRRFFVRRAWLSLGVVALLCSPHWYWLGGHLASATSSSINKMDVAATGSALISRLNGLVSVGEAVLGVAGLLLLVLFAVFWRRNNRKAPELNETEQGLALFFKRYLILSLSLLLIFVLFGVGNFKARWLLPSFIFFPAIAGFYLFHYRETTLRQMRAVFIITALIGVTIPCVLFIRIALARGHYTRLNEPYRELVQQFAVTDDLLVLTDQHRIAGNLKHQLKGNVLVLTSDRPSFPANARSYKTVAVAWRGKTPEDNPVVPDALMEFAKAQTGCDSIVFDHVETLSAPDKYGDKQRFLHLAWARME